MRRSAVSAGLSAWKLGRLEVIWESRIVDAEKYTVITTKCPFIALKKFCLYLCRYIQYTRIRKVMKMLSIAVCDDKVIECCNMARKIKDILEDMKIPCIIRQFQSGRELLQALESFDIVFLDIIMQDLDGMKTAQIFREKASDKILIFVSSSREYVFEAYDVEAFQYLLKPVDDRKLKKVLQKAVLKTEKRTQEFIIVSRERQKKKLFLDDIYYFEIKGRMVDVHGLENIFTYYGQIGELENRLRDKGFFRCHKSYLVNLKYVDGYNRQEVILENGEKIVIAKRRYEEFCQEVLKVMCGNGGGL